MKRRKKKLRVSHVVPVTSHLSGMYETVRELVKAERALGVNAMIVDPRPSSREKRGKVFARSSRGVKCPKCDYVFSVVDKKDEVGIRPPAYSADRGVVIADFAFAKTSDVIVSHGGLTPAFDTLDIPRVHVAHGRPNSSYRIERDGGSPIYSMYKDMMQDERWKCMVTLWPGFERYWKLVFQPVRQFQPFVDLDYWTREETDYDFGGNKGEINVVMADIWRKDKDPFHILNAFVLFAEKHEGAKLHIYGIDGNGLARDTLFDCLKDRGILGEVKPIVSNLRTVYSAGDMLITPHKIATRTIREALACGLNVVAGYGNPYVLYSADEEDLTGFSEAMDDAWEDWRTHKEQCIETNRGRAEREFDPARTAGQFIELFKDILNVKNERVSKEELVTM